MTHIRKHILIALLTAYSVFLSQTAQAVSVTPYASGDIRAKDVFVVDVVMKTDGQEVNTVEGELVIADRTNNFEIRDISIAGSGLTMWPRKPSLSIDGKTISFAGGIPAGIAGEVPLFKVIIFTRNAGELRVTPRAVTAYANDGKGTALSVSPVEKIVTIAPEDRSVGSKDEWVKTVSNDNTAPQPFEISLHQDASLYGGNKFLSFPALDNESGISYYEVQEGNSLPVRTGDQYVLVNQGKMEVVTVTAYDASGNARIGIFDGRQPINWYAIVFWVIILFIIRQRKGIIRIIKKYGKRTKRSI